MTITEVSRPIASKPYEIKYLSGHRPKETASRPKVEQEAGNPLHVLRDMHLGAVSALSTYASFVTHEGNWHTASTLRGNLPPDKSPEPKIGDTWMEVAINCPPWDLTRLHEPTEWDISFSEVTVKKLVATENGLFARRIYTIRSNSDSYRPIFMDGDGKHLLPESDDFTIALGGMNALVNHHISKLPQ
jgi:hypothetical protein